MNILNWFRSEPTQLKLRDDGMTDRSKVGMPKAPPLDTSLDSLLKYSKRSELVYACIEKKAQAACDAVLVVEKKSSGDDWTPLPTHPLISLLNKPNIWDDGESFIRAWVASENFSDNFYCEIVRSAAGIPVALYPLNPVYMLPQWIMTSMGWKIDFYYYFQNGYPVRLEVEDVMVRRRHGLGSIYSEVSAVQIALGSIDADAAATDYVRAFFNNGGSPSGILNVKDKRLSDDEAKAMQQKWTQRYGRGGTNRGGVAVLDGQSAEYQSVGSKLNELNSKELNEKIETRICMAFGVPPIIVGALVGLQHVTQNATSKAAMGEFWAHTMSPELKSIRNYITWNLLPMFEPIEAIKAGTIRVNWDMSQVMALQEDVDAVHSRVGEGYQNGVYMLNEARSRLGLDPVPPEIGDQFYKAPTPVHVGDPNAVPPKEKPKSDDPLDASIIEPAQKKTFDFNGLTLCREPTALERTIDLKGMAASFDAGKSQMAQVLLSLRGELIKQSAAAISKLDGKDVHELALVPPDKAYSRVRKATEALFQVGRTQVDDDLARQGKKGTGPGETKDLSERWQAFIDRIVDRTISRIINEIQTRAINFFVARGLLDENDDQIIKELRAALEDQSLKTFEDMAQQTANAAIGGGRDAELTARADDIEMYEYSAILDANTCDPCESADGQQSADVNDLPEAPNPDCEGGSRCRCFRIGIGKEENA